MAQPISPFGDIDAGAISIHEIFSAYIRAGFKREEALELVKIIVVEMTKLAMIGVVDKGNDGHDQNN